MLRLLSVFLPLLMMLSPVTSNANQQDSVVHAVLFYSPTCPHCHTVINEDLPAFYEGELDTIQLLAVPTQPGEEQAGWPAFSIVGSQLETLLVNTYTQLGGQLYQNMAERFEIPPEERFVPLMVVGETVLVGGYDIPTQLAVIMEQGLASGGIDWPDIPGLDLALDALQPVEVGEPANPDPSEDESPEDIADPSTDSPPSIETGVRPLTVLEKIKLDPLGNSISILVLAGMLASVGALGALTWKGRTVGASWAAKVWPFVALCVVGMGVAGYLAYVETTDTPAICGPVGDCNTVQQSKYAKIFGLIPVGTFGLSGYIAMLAAWLIAHLNKDTRLADYAAVANFGMAIFGVLFSIYLTVLEPFVIGATCAWCLSSAIIMTLLMWLSSSPGLEAWRRLRKPAA
jgi:hypothetical protein